MFYHKNSSKSSDEALQINLLQPKDRQSRIKITRTNHTSSPAYNPTMHPPPSTSLHKMMNLNKGKGKRSSAIVSLKRQFDDELQGHIYDSYSALGNVDFSESLLTNTNDNSTVVGIILFLLMAVMEVMENFALCAFQRWAEVDAVWPMMAFLAASEVAAFGVLYSCKWVERLSLIVSFVRNPRKNNSRCQPILLLSLTLMLTILWQTSYTISLIHNVKYSSSHLILFYFTILPQIAGSLLFEEQITKDLKLRVLLYFSLLYVILYALFVHLWIGLGAISGVLLMVLGIIAGRAVLLMQYGVKIAILLVSCVAVVMTQPEQTQWWQQDYPYPNHPSIVQTILFGIFTTLSIILVRCINNKILRTQLYKYYYLDHTINCVLLALPVIYGYIDNSIVDLWIGILGPLFFFSLCLVLGRKKQIIQIQLQSQCDGDKMQEVGKGNNTQMREMQEMSKDKQKGRNMENNKY